MSDKKPDVLVICSTFNQITNYLMIKKFGSLEIYNITYNPKLNAVMHPNIENIKWDKQLKTVLEEDCGEFDELEPIFLDEDNERFYDIKNTIEKIEEKISKDDKRCIYWHITGGQRLVALAVSEFVRERKQDKIIYVEGNTEKYLVYSNNYVLEGEYSYHQEGLSLKTALHLMGFDYNSKTKSARILKMKDSCDDQLKNEMEFYQWLYTIFCQQSEKKITIEIEEEKIIKTFREHFVFNNSLKTSEGKRKHMKLLFQNLQEEFQIPWKYDIAGSKEMGMGSPAGYIFEKLVAYQIYRVLQDKSCRISEMALSLKVYFSSENTSNDSVDELDIALMSNAGRLYNFECKTGGMEGDNAKSHNYTTYRLAGVFGMPILISPLLKGEISNSEKKEEFKKQFAAIHAADRAMLHYFCIDELKAPMLEQLGIKED